MKRKIGDKITKDNNSDECKKIINMKPFDLEAAKAGKPVCTRDGRKARIIAFDIKNDEYPIVATVECRGNEFVNSYTINGKYDSSGKCFSYLDLMMAAEKKKGYIALYKPKYLNAAFPLTTSNVYETLELLETYTDKKGRIAIKEIEWED